MQSSMLDEYWASKLGCTIYVCNSICSVAMLPASVLLYQKGTSSLHVHTGLVGQKKLRGPCGLWL